MYKSAASIQRLYEYSNNCQVEKDLYEPKAPQNWPTEGKIEFKGVSVRYREKLPLVLDNINFTIEGKQKVGIVGRTGSGKSTMLLVLTRCLEMQDETIKSGSYMKLDDVETHNIGLHELRKNITIIPQDPVM